MKFKRWLSSKLPLFKLTNYLKLLWAKHRARPEQHGLAAYQVVFGQSDAHWRRQQHQARLQLAGVVIGILALLIGLFFGGRWLYDSLLIPTFMPEKVIKQPSDKPKQPDAPKPNEPKTPDKPTPPPATPPPATPGPPAIEIHADASGVDQAILQRAMAAAPAGSLIRLQTGRYARQNIQNSAKALTITAAAGVVVNQLVLTNVQNANFQNLYINGFAAGGGIEINDGSAHLRFDGVTIDGTASAVNCGANANTARGFYIRGSKDRASWPNDIWLTNSNVFGVPSDLVAAYTGVQNLHINNNQIHDFRSGSCAIGDEHNDGIQIVAADTVEIRGNVIYSPPARLGGPDQGIILGGNGNPSVQNVTITGNVIKNWPGTAIIVAGTGTTNIQVNGNTVTCAWGGVVINNNGANVTASGNAVSTATCPG